MKNLFRYFLILSVIIIPLFFLYKEKDQFPILAGAFIGVTITYWIAVVVLKIKNRNKETKP